MRHLFQGVALAATMAAMMAGAAAPAQAAEEAEFTYRARDGVHFLLAEGERFGLAVVCSVDMSVGGEFDLLVVGRGDDPLPTRKSGVSVDMRVDGSWHGTYFTPEADRSVARASPALSASQSRVMAAARRKGGTMPVRIMGSRGVWAQITVDMKSLTPEMAGRLSRHCKNR